MNDTIETPIEVRKPITVEDPTAKITAQEDNGAAPEASVGSIKPRYDYDVESEAAEEGVPSEVPVADLATFLAATAPPPITHIYPGLTLGVIALTLSTFTFGFTIATYLAK